MINEVKNISEGQVIKNPRIDGKGCKLINQVPPGLLGVIFTYLQPQEIGKSSFLVSKKWYGAASERFVQLKKEIYKGAFNKKKWENAFGKDIFKGDDADDFEKLPKDIVKILYSSSPFFDKKRVIETDYLVWIPKTINGNPVTLGELVKEKYFPETEDGYSDILNEVLKEENDRPGGESHWALITRKFILGNGNKSFIRQKNLNSKTNTANEVPNMRDVFIGIFARHIESNGKEFLFDIEPPTYTSAVPSYTSAVPYYHPSGLVGHDFLALNGLL